MTPIARDRLLCVAALAAMAAHPLAPLGSPWEVHAAASLASVAVACLSWRASPAVRSLTAMVACLSVAVELPVVWQPVMLVALAAFLVITRVLPSLAPGPSWRAMGPVPVGWTLLVGGVTPVALSGWVFLFRPDLHDVVNRYVPKYPLPLPVLIGGAIGFAAVNAMLEEHIWRGVIQDRLEPVFGANAAVAIQAASFGVQHFHGVPRGVVGVLLAGTWAVMLGLLRRHTRGLRAPILAHIVADGVVAIIVLVYARG